MERDQDRAIWKFVIDVKDEFFLEMPPGAKVLSVQEQDGVPCLWAAVRPSAAQHPQQRRFFVVGTGHPMPKDATKYLGTFQLQGGAFIGHLWE
jgi:hypothetical protein